jgi:hypothetical protein
VAGDAVGRAREQVGAQALLGCGVRRGGGAHQLLGGEVVLEIGQRLLAALDELGRGGSGCGGSGLKGEEKQNRGGHARSVAQTRRANAPHPPRRGIDGEA